MLQSYVSTSSFRTKQLLSNGSNKGQRWFISILAASHHHPAPHHLGWGSPVSSAGPRRSSSVQCGLFPHHPIQPTAGEQRRWRSSSGECLMLTRWMWAAVSLCFLSAPSRDAAGGGHRSPPSRCFCPPAVAAQGSNSPQRGTTVQLMETLVYRQNQGWGGGALPRSTTVFGVAIFGPLEEAKWLSDPPEMLHMRR